MPACFQLFPKESDKASLLQDIDNDLRKAFGAESDPENYYKNWFDIIGFRLAIGLTFDQILIEFAKDVTQPLKSYDNHTIELIRITNWLAEHYSPQAWREV